MAKLTNKQRYELKQHKKYRIENEERLKAWNILRKVPEYKKDYHSSLSIKSKTSKKAKDLENKWGFFPLADPTKDDQNFEFLNYFGSYSEEKDRFKDITFFEGLEFYSRDKNKIYDHEDMLVTKPLPKTITVKISIYEPQTVIIEEFREKIKHIQKTFQIRPKKSPHHHHKEFITIVLKNAGLDESSIKKHLTPPDLKDEKCTNNFKDSSRNTISYWIKKHGK